MGAKTIHVVGDSHVMLFTGQKLPYLIQPPTAPDYQPMGYDIIPNYVTYFCVLLRAFRLVDNDFFWEILNRIPKGSTVVLVVGEIDCRGPILNVAHRTGIDIADIVKLCVGRYLVGVQTVKDMGLNPIIFAPYAQKNLTEIKHDWVKLPEYLTPKQWCVQKRLAVNWFELFLKQSDFPVVSLNRWMIYNEIHDSDEYWADPIHLSEKAWPLIEEQIQGRII